MRRLALLLSLWLLAAPALAATLANGPSDFDASTKAGDPAWQAAAVTASDSNDVPLLQGCTALWVGGAGAVSVVMASQWLPAQTATQALAAAVTFTGVNAGQWLPIRVSRVMSTSTTATSIVCVSR